MKICFYLFFIFTLPIYGQDKEFKWIEVGNGINYVNVNRNGSNHILFCFGGWTTKNEWVQTWALELHKCKLEESGFGHIYAIKGPDQVFFDSLEIENNLMAIHFINLFDSLSGSCNEVKITVLAHSSGAFVAHHFFSQLFGTLTKNAKIKNRIEYYNLDGDIGSETVGTSLNDNIISNLKKVYAVAAYEKSSRMYSPNLSAMLNLSYLFKEKSELVIVDSESSGCKGKWCVHDILINRVPHNPLKFDLERDYTIFDKDHPVCTDYLKNLK